MMLDFSCNKRLVAELNRQEICTRNTVMQHSSIQHVYTLYELEEEIKVLSKTFDNVRLVSPADCRVVLVENGRLSLADSCHTLWRRSSPCEYCLSRRIVISHSTGMKTEFIDGYFFLVFAKYVLLEDKELSLEMISKVASPFCLEQGDSVLGEISRLEKENSRLMRDPLTNCYSRHYLNENFQHYARVAKNRELDLCVAFFDMDKFKDINDRYGHAIGDTVLKSCCSFWLKYFDDPGWSFVTRYGGDEFVIVSMANSYREFCFRLGHLAGSMRKTIVMSDGSAIPFSFTMGCSSMEEVRVMSEHAGWDTIFPLADKRMYQGKSTGRGCIVTGIGEEICCLGRRSLPPEE